MSTCISRKQNGRLFIEPHFRQISCKILLATELSIRSVTGCHGKVHTPKQLQRIGIISLC